MNMERHGGMVLAGKSPGSSTGVLSHLAVRQEELAKEMMNSDLRDSVVHSSKFSIICRKIVPHRADGFISSPKDGVLKNFVAPKNPSSQHDLNPITSSPMASTLNITVPRTTISVFYINDVELSGYVKRELLLYIMNSCE
jgi:hypothetical protein